MSKNKDFWQKNFSWMHLVAMAVGLVLSLLYWYKAGQFSDNFFQKWKKIAKNAQKIKKTIKKEEMFSKY